MTPPHYADESVTLYAGDALDVLRTLPDNSVDSVVTDPPAGIAFMGKAWDGAKGGREQWSAWLAAIMAEALRVTKPGGHALVWALPRTAHWTACGLEDAGWEIRDRITHLFGSGFPKSLDVGKAIDRRPGVHQHPEFAAHLAARREAAGLTRAQVSEAVVGTASGACWNWEHHQFPEAKWWPALRDLLDMDEDKWGPVIAEAERAVTGTRRVVPGVAFTTTGPSRLDVTAPATDAARRWDGWGTALKPAAEDWWLCRRPLEGTVAGNVTRWGTGALNVAACRVGTDPIVVRGGGGTFDSNGRKTPLPTGRVDAERVGRWPPNALLDTAAAQQLDRETGVLTSGDVAGSRRHTDGGNGTTHGRMAGAVGASYADKGGASRFFPTFPAADPADPGHLPAHRTSGSGGLPAPEGGRGNAGSGEGIRAPLRDPGADADAALRFAPPDPLPAWRYEPKAPGFERPQSDGLSHPTVKSLDLVRWLCRLVTPPGGTVLDMFAGSGTTGEAAVVEGFRAILVEREAAYLPLIVARLSKPIQPDLFGGVA